jgi:toxin ParE1/3/4
MASVDLTPIAESDLVQIWLYVATNSEESADRLLTRFEQAFAQLAEHPQLGELITRLPFHFRVFSVGNYVVAYQEMREGILVLRVMHAARNWQQIIADNLP